jgi:hypothetical protein
VIAAVPAAAAEAMNERRVGIVSSRQMVILQPRL